jgi:chromosome segregation ATPase
LQDELSVEEKLFEEAQANLKEGEANPETFKSKDGATHRNMAKYDEKIKSLNEQINLHQSNIDALNTELSKLK